MKALLSTPLLTAGLALVLSASSPAGEEGRKLLAETISDPGFWLQMCSGPDPLPFEAPVPVFSGSLIGRHFYLGTKETERLQTKRGEVIPALVEALKAMDLTKPPKETGARESGGLSGRRTGQKLEWLSPIHLQIIAALNAVETLPELLRLEEQIDGLITAAEKDKDVPLPPLDLGGPALFEKPGEKPADRPEKWWERPEYKRDEAIFKARVTRGELLGMMTLLLRNEEFAPAKEKLEVLKGEMKTVHLASARKTLAEAKEQLPAAEKKYAASQAKEDRSEVRAIKGTIGEAKEEISRLETPDGPRFEADYTPALRAEIRALTDSFLKTVPPEKRRGAGAMPKVEK